MPEIRNKRPNHIQRFDEISWKRYSLLKLPFALNHIFLSLAWQNSRIYNTAAKNMIAITVKILIMMNSIGLVQHMPPQKGGHIINQPLFACNLYANNIGEDFKRRHFGRFQRIQRIRFNFQPFGFGGFNQSAHIMNFTD